MTKYFLARAREKEGESGAGRRRPCRQTGMATWTNYSRMK